MTIDKEIRFYTGDRADLRDVELGAKERGIEEDYGHHLAYKDELGNYHVCALQVEAGLVDAGFVVGDSDGKLTIGTDLTCNSINVNSTIAVVGTIDDDTFATATDTTWATSESIKAYVDSAVLAEDFWDKTSNVVHLKTATDQVHIGGTTSGSKVNITYETATTSAAIDILKLVAHSSGTAAAGFGGSIQWVMENAAGNDGTWGRINCILTDAGNGTEDSAFLFYTYKAGTGLREVVRIDSDGFVGIGVTNPDTKLEVFSAAATQLKLSYDGTYYSTLGTSATGMLNLVASGGFVGIGVTDPDTALEIYKAGTQLKLSYDGTYNCTFAVDTNGNMTITPSGDQITISTPDGRNTALLIDSGDTASATLERYAIDNDSYVAFNTGATLDWIMGTGRSGGSDDDFRIEHHTGAAWLTDIFIDKTNGYVVVGKGLTSATTRFMVVDGGASTNTEASFTAYTQTAGYNAQINLRRSNNNNIGTMQVTAPGQTLGSLSFQGVAVDTVFREGANIKVIQKGTAGASRIPADIAFYTSPGGTTSPVEHLRIDSDGFVGIGVTNPDTKLEVFSAAATQLKLSYDGTYYSTLGTSATGMLNLVASGGFVGIGVTDPDTALEIYKAGTQLKLSYDAPHYTTLSSDPSGILQIYPSGSYISFNNNSTLFIDGTGKLLTNRIEDASGGTIDIEAIVEIGGVANYSKFESDGTLVFVGDATVWEDISIDLSPLQTGGTKPGFVTVASTNIRLLSFALNEDVDGSFEIPHAYKLSSNMTPHIHFLPTDAPSAGPDYVTFEMEYFIVNTDGTVSTSTTIDSGDVEIDTQWKVQRVDLPTISNSTLGGQVAFKIKRTGASTNQYGGECAVLTLGFHYEKDAVGSRQIGVK